MRTRWGHCSLLSLVVPHVRDKAHRQRGVGKILLLEHVYSGEDFGSERPWAAGIQEEG